VDLGTWRMTQQWAPSVCFHLLFPKLVAEEADNIGMPVATNKKCLKAHLFYSVPKRQGKG
jgi:hypothetical protein